MTLEQKMIAILNETNNFSVSSWDMANKIYNNCMNTPKPGNGVRIANLRRAAEKSVVVGTFISSTNGDRMFHLIDKNS
ncbi:hypothetical protein B9J93_03755 [Vibrio sp. V17_P4S1T151]|uniref:hypothetical protein n=1 Tax=unclassified Vibrio TaxID=2614977 RepID=UPI000B8E3159|nr:MULTISPECIES: hypothetical protein [unclassified Vibrio]OXX48850.1 hypothetical protein B9J93_03755 [Vibrio sp. V17_P4S1T151]OXX65163.1 hypothetical protein B9J89_04550 [Vibrio sp. V15_P4S5T153]